MKYFIDTEFIEKPNTIQLISIGIKCEDGRKYYAVCSDYNFDDADEWVVENVLTPMWNKEVSELYKPSIKVNEFHKYFGISTELIKKQIINFIGEDESPEFWGYYSDYDWVVFCWIFGKMVDLPKIFPMYCRDLKQSLDESGKEDFPSPDGEHDAMVDAEWNEQLYHYIFN